MPLAEIAAAACTVEMAEKAEMVEQHKKAQMVEMVEMVGKVEMGMTHKAIEKVAKAVARQSPGIVVPEPADHTGMAGCDTD